MIYADYATARDALSVDPRTAALSWRILTRGNDSRNNDASSVPTGVFGVSPSGAFCVTLSPGRGAFADLWTTRPDGLHDNTPTWRDPVAVAVWALDREREKIPTRLARLRVERDAAIAAIDALTADASTVSA